MTEADLIALRPGDGISPARRKDVVGLTAKAAIAAGTKLAVSQLA